VLKSGSNLHPVLPLVNQLSYEVYSGYRIEQGDNENFHSKEQRISIDPRDPNPFTNLIINAWKLNMGDTSAKRKIIATSLTMTSAVLKTIGLLPADFIAQNEDLFNIIKERVDWITINAGQVLVFNQNLPHGNRVNSENETRWSMNCRFKSIFAPYSDKKNGEYYEPITLRAASRVGASYKFPELE
jgi:hypothetical protein